MNNNRLKFIDMAKGVGIILVLFGVIDRFGGKAVLLGYDNRVGGDRLTTDQISDVALGLGLEVIRTESVSAAGETVISSTKIREAIAGGDVESASGMLGYGYSLTGVVVAGNRLGRTIGFPTANIQLYEPLKLIPGNGVYSVGVETVGRRLRGMCNIKFSGRRTPNRPAMPRTISIPPEKSAYIQRVKPIMPRKA